MTQPVSAIPRSERIARWILAISFVLLVVVLAGTFIKVPYAVEKPGPVTDTLGALDDGTDLVRVKGTKSYPTDGALYFTTVRVLGGPERHINVWEWVAGHLDGDSRVLPEDEVFPADTTDEEVREMNTAQMQGAQKNSIAVGLRSTGVKVPQVNLVATIAEDLPADGRLALEDEVLEVDGKRTEHVADIVSAISDRTPGDTVRLTVERKGREREVEMKTTDLGGGRAGIGIALEPKYDYPYEVRIDAGDVGGPSAGMMFALAVHDRITPGPLTGGEQIAGTGTIDDAGTVGPIGGIQQKLVGAKAGGAQWFLAPESNCDEVVGHVPEGLRVAAVGDFDEATETVEAIADGETGDLQTCEQVVARAS
ncbi:YlbL family protein [Janibacter indicus]|uniref:YlbL family protein n=1 Tax=Janibacter indicus TaxID=857417 RepID=UPI003D9A3847